MLQHFSFSPFSTVLPKVTLVLRSLDFTRPPIPSDRTPPSNDLFIPMTLNSLSLLLTRRVLTSFGIAAGEGSIRDERDDELRRMRKSVSHGQTHSHVIEHAIHLGGGRGGGLDCGRGGSGIDGTWKVKGRARCLPGKLQAKRCRCPKNSRNHLLSR